MSEIEMSEYEQHQLGMMRDFLADYTCHGISLKRPIDVMEGLLLCVPDFPLNWRTELHEHWFSLEQARAIVLDRGEDVSEFSTEIDAAIAISNKEINLLGGEMKIKNIKEIIECSFGLWISVLFSAIGGWNPGISFQEKKANFSIYWKRFSRKGG